MTHLLQCCLCCMAFTLSISCFGCLYNHTHGCASKQRINAAVCDNSLCLCITRRAVFPAHNHQAQKQNLHTFLHSVRLLLLHHVSHPMTLLPLLPRHSRSLRHSWSQIIPIAHCTLYRIAAESDVLTVRKWTSAQYQRSSVLWRPPCRRRKPSWQLSNGCSPSGSGHCSLSHCVACIHAVLSLSVTARSDILPPAMTLLNITAASHILLPLTLCCC